MKDLRDLALPCVGITQPCSTKDNARSILPWVSPEHWSYTHVKLRHGDYQIVQWMLVSDATWQKAIDTRKTNLIRPVALKSKPAAAPGHDMSQLILGLLCIIFGGPKCLTPTNVLLLDLVFDVKEERMSQ